MSLTATYFRRRYSYLATQTRAMGLDCKKKQQPASRISESFFERLSFEKLRFSHHLLRHNLFISVFTHFFLLSKPK